VAISNLGFEFNKVALIDSLVFNIQLAGASWLVSLILKYYLPQKERSLYLLAVSTGLSGLILFDSKYILQSLFANDPEYLHFLSASLSIRFGINALAILCMCIISILWYSLEEEKENQRRKADTEKLAREAELYKLRQQLQPHFLFNSLNSISALVGRQPEKAREMIQQLSDFLRGTLKKEDQQWVLLGEEFQYLELYLEIEKVRFGHRLSAIISSEPACIDRKLPPMLLQPIVENAIKFGLYDTLEDITIHVKASVKGNLMEVSVENPFDPETAYPKEGTGFGLSSVNRRLFLLFGRADLLETRVNGNLYTTTIKIPTIS
jgi:sensor histidine kinase YesM